MDIAAIAIKNRVVTLVMTVIMVVVGIESFQNMSRLEDPEFTIKDALVMTPYPGASAEEVEQEVGIFLVDEDGFVATFGENDLLRLG